MSIDISLKRAGVLAAAVTALLSGPAQAELTFDEAIRLALQNDPWQTDNRLQEEALRERARAAGALPDPMVRLAMANLPTDTLDLDQENMTQLQFGVSQTFPRGDSRALSEQRLRLQADANPWQRAERAAQLRRMAGRLWLEIYSREAQIRLINDNRHLFRQLVDVATANYRLGGSRSHDLVRAELELTRLDDRITRLQQERDRLYGELARWLPEQAALQPLAAKPPQLRPAVELAEQISPADEQRLLRHPRIRIIDQQLKVAQQDISLSEQAYSPQFKVDANYGYRLDSPDGRERADLFTLAVSFDLPLFPERRQDPLRRATVKQHEGLREQRLLALRELRAELYREHANWRQLRAREALFDQRLLRQMGNQTEAAMRAYAADSSDFAEVMRAAIAELDSRLERIRLTSARQQSVLNLNYILANADDLAESTP